VGSGTSGSGSLGFVGEGNVIISSDNGAAIAVSSSRFTLRLFSEVLRLRGGDVS
jgi:hypothetical protein